jgi:hypothetical protein
MSKTESMPKSSTNILTNSVCLNDEWGEKLMNGTIVVSCGGKGSGKTTFFLANLRAMLDQDAFEDYQLIIPSLFIEADDSYAWLREEKRLTIYTKYHQSLLTKILKRNSNPKTQLRTLFVIDDATKFAADLHDGHNEELISFVSEARHVHVTSWILLHSLKNVLSPIMRENLGFLVIYDISNRKLLDDVWQEYLSVSVDHKPFLEWFRDISIREFGSFMLKTTKPRVIDIDSNDWEWVTKMREFNERDKEIRDGKKIPHNSIACQPPSDLQKKNEENEKEREIEKDTTNLRTNQSINANRECRSLKKK